MKAPISVVIPTFNRCESLVNAIESVVNQSLPPTQIIVVDDGSSDDTTNMVRKHFPSVELLLQDNHGVSHARNQGIAVASEPWIAFLDSDDRWFDNKLSRQIDALNASPSYKICHSDEHWIRNGKRVNPMNKHQKRGGEIFEHCLPLCAISPSSVVIHQSIFTDIGTFDEYLPACEDYDLWLRICAKHPVLFIEDALLEKTGGHEDQLSRKHWGMDRFRLHALAKLLRSKTLNDQQHAITLSTFNGKYEILLKGATKRNKEEFVAELQALYVDIISSPN